MKKHFIGKSFSDELEIWHYLQSIKTQDLQEPDGHYCLEFCEPYPGQLQFRCCLKISDRKALHDILYPRPLEKPRCYIYIKDGVAFCVGIDSAYVIAHDEIEAHGNWEIAFFEDWMSELPEGKRQLTPEECAAACDALVELLIMNAKKVA